MTSRRFFLLGAASLIAAPAIVRADSLMKIVVPKPVLGPLNEYLLAAMLRDIETVNARIEQAVFSDLFEAIHNPYEGRELIRADWPSRTIKAPPSGFKLARG